MESIDICVDWWSQRIPQNNRKVLIFNTTGDRDSKKMMEFLSQNCDFDIACFAPNIPFSGDGKSKDTISILYPNQDQIKRAKLHTEYWNSFPKNKNKGNQFNNIIESLFSIKKFFTENENIDILITGSLHLIGAAILSLEEYDKRRFFL